VKLGSSNSTVEFAERRSIGDPWLALIDRARIQSWWQLEFSGPLKERYDKETAGRRTSNLRILFGILLFLCAIAPLQDTTLSPQSFRESMIFRYGLMVPACLLGIIFSSKRFPLWLQAMAGYLPIILLTVAGALFSRNLPPILSEKYFHGLLMILTGSNLIMTERFRHAFFLTVTGLAAILLLYPYHSGQIYFIPLFVVPCILTVISLLLRFRQDNLERRSWIAEFKNNLQNNQLESMVNVDALTGISNRRYFDGALRQMWSVAQKQYLPIAVVMMDIDRFKDLNDLAGHLEGDNCLAAVGQALQEQVRIGVDVLARYGGDEFVVILPGAGEEMAMVVAERLRTVVEEMKLGEELLQSIPLTLTVGVACFEPKQRTKLAEWMQNDTVKSYRSLLKAADEALYRAKQAGGNRVEIAA